jgi:uncharacterized Tic20 family protein
MKKCPLCAEEIQEDAVKCKHCGELIVKPKSSETAKAASERSEKNLAMWCHLGTFSGILIPFGNFLAPLLIWLAKRDEYPLVEDQGKEALNFQLSLSLYSIIGFVLVFLIVGIFILVVLALFGIIQVIKASISANNGEKYRYPLCLRVIK